jgi:sulfoxide reductase heme-binding subunit YedZ
MTGPLTGAASISPSAFWYLTRGSGIVTLVLLTVSVSLGVLTSVRWRSKGLPRFVVAGLHRNVTLLAVVFLAIHVSTTIIDGYTPIGLRDAFIPFLSPYRPIWLGLGALSSDLLAAVVVTSLLRARLGFRTWRTVHWLAYATWPLALIHSLGTGSDARFGWMAALGLGCVAAVTFSVLLRAGYGEGTARVRTGAVIAAVLVPVGLIVWYQGGPAQHGWAARAGTPTAILHAHAAAVSLRRSRPRVARLPATFDGRLSGRLTQSGPDADGLVGVRIDAAVGGRVRGKIRLVLRGSPTEGGGVSMTSSGVAFATSGASAVYEGSIVGLNGDQLTARVSAPTAGTVELQLSLRLNTDTGTVTGRVHGSSVRGAQ